MSNFQNEPAFPITYPLGPGETDLKGVKHPDHVTVTHSGLTIREYAAIKAMQALIPISDNGNLNDAYSTDWVAKRAKQYADALIAELENDAE